MHTDEFGAVTGQGEALLNPADISARSTFHGIRAADVADAPTVEQVASTGSERCH